MKTNLLRTAFLALGLGSVLLTSTNLVAAGGEWIVPKDSDIPNDSSGESIRYGKRLIEETSAIIGPEAKDPAMRFSGNNLDCQSCHLVSGKKRYSAPFIDTSASFPRFEKRQNAQGTLEDRINGCMERSMNGRVFPKDSKELTSIAAYMNWLGAGVKKGEKVKGGGFPKFEPPNRTADPEAGKVVYERQCQHCHGADGGGVRRTSQYGKGKVYLFPPLWGDDSYNQGAGMNRLLTAAAFIRGNMPFGATYESPILTEDEAYDVAAFIDSKPRPDKPGKELDYPKKGAKPVDKSYPPYDDHFSQMQHKYGPFQPIIEYYDALKKEAKK